MPQQNQSEPIARPYNQVVNPMIQVSLEDLLGMGHEEWYDSARSKRAHMQAVSLERPRSTLHHLVHEVQRHTHPSPLTQMIAWHNFGSSHLQAASPDHPKQRQLIDRVVDLAQKRGIEHIPEIFIIKSDIPNAASINGEAMVYTTALLNRMSPNELDAITGHELAHHRHNQRDNLVQGGIVVLASKIGVDGWFAATSALTPQLPFLAKYALGIPVVAALTRAAITPYRHFMEYESDKEGAELTHPVYMKTALQSLEKQGHALHQSIEGEKGIWRNVSSILLFPFSSHPSTISRIGRLDHMKGNALAVKESSSMAVG